MSDMAGLAEPGALESKGRARGEETDLPGLGVLVRNELLKTRHRMAFWVAFLFFLLVVFLQAFDGLYRVLRTDDPSHFSLPGAWHDILLGGGPTGALFAATALTLLVGSEWSWKTARQNVIDGLSKDQFFYGKVLLMGMLAVVFLGGQVLLAGGMAAWSTDFGAGPFLRGHDLVLAAGALVMMLGYMSIALACAFSVRSTGSALGLFFIYIALAEQLVGGALGRLEWTRPAARYLPRTVFDQFFRPGQWDLARRQALVQRAELQGRPAPEFFDSTLLFVLGLAWIAALVGVAYAAHRRKDL